MLVLPCSVLAVQTLLKHVWNIVGKKNSSYFIYYHQPNKIQNASQPKIIIIIFFFTLDPLGIIRYFLKEKFYTFTYFHEDKRQKYACKLNLIAVFLICP